MSFVAGGNNSGKSTILQGLAIWEFCRAVIEAEKGKDYFLPQSTHQGRGMSHDEFSPLNLPSLRHLWTNLSPQKTKSDPDGYTLRIQCTWQANGASKELEFGLALANDRLFVKTTHSNLVQDDQIPRVAYLPPFAGITNREPRVPGAIRRRRIGEGLAGAVLRNMLLDLYQANSQARAKLRAGKGKLSDTDLSNLRKSDPWELLQQALRTTFSSELIVAQFKEEYHSYIKIEVAKGDVKDYKWFYKLTRYPGYKNRDIMVEGGGFLQWLSVFTLAANPEIDVLLLDEPDAHLHTSLQQILVQKLIDLTEKTGKQVLIATHSSEILMQSPPTRILAVAFNKPPGYLTLEHQKVGLLAGIGTQYAPRIDSAKREKRIIFVEGDSDFEILQKFAERLNSPSLSNWVKWTSKAGNKERKQIFIALQEEIPDLVAVSIRDRDDENVNTVGDNLEDNAVSIHNLHCKKWRRRNIESYLIWPGAIAGALNKPQKEIEDCLSKKFCIAVGESFQDAMVPDALLQVDGKQVLGALGADPIKVANQFPTDRIPIDIRKLIDELDELSKGHSST